MDEYELAELIHSKQCRYNHIDQCGWMYENNPKYAETKWQTGWAHKYYLDRTQKLISDLKMDLNDIAKVIRAL